MAKIIGNTTATPNPQADWNQTDSTKTDYIKNKPVIADNNTTYTLTKEDNKIYLRGSDGSEMFVIDSSADAGNNTTYQLIEEGNKHILVGSDGSRTEVIDHGAEYVEQVQSDWNQDDDTKADYIKNKPELGELALKSEVTKADLAADIQVLLTDIPDALSDLDEDSTHRTVTDAEKAVWNAKSNFSGLYDDLIDKPPLDYIPTAQKGMANGVAELDANGRVLSSQLPSYVDDVLEYASKSLFPSTGESGKIYIDTTTNKTYRWSGSVYAEISESLALGTTSSTAYRGDYGNTAYIHSQEIGNPHGVTKSDIGLSNVEDKSSTTIRSEITKENITTALGYTPLDETEIASTTTQNSNVSYIKAVPDNSASYAKILKIGGMSYKSANLIDIVEKTVTGPSYIFYDVDISSMSISKGDYAFSFKAKNFTDGAQFQLVFRDENRNPVADSGAKYVYSYNAITVALTAKPKYVELFTSSDIGGTFYDFTLNKGPTAKPYSPYFEGLRHAKVTAVKSNGANILTEASLKSGMYWDGDPVTFQGLGGMIGAEERIPLLPNTTYCLSTTNADFGGAIWVVDENYKSLFRTDGWTFKNGSTFTTPDVPCYALFCGWYSGEYRNDLMLHIGTSPLPYKPHREPIALPIPEDVRPAHGIPNTDVYDCITWDEDGKQRNRVKCGVVDLGTLNWHRSDTENPYFQANGALVEKSAAINAQVICGNYQATTAWYVYQTDIDKAISAESEYIVARDTSYTDAATFKAAMSGVMLVYELATPEVTDISDILTKDGLLQVEVNGHVEIVTDNCLATASTIEFYENITEVFAADTLVGDLAGTAARALADSEGNTFAKVATSGDYNDLVNKPDVASKEYVDDAIKNIIITPGGGSNNLSDYNNDIGFITSDDIKASDASLSFTIQSPIDKETSETITLKAPNYNELPGIPNLATVATSGNYNDLTNKPSVPTETSDLTADRLVGESGAEIEFTEYGEGYSLINLKAHTVQVNDDNIATVNQLPTDTEKAAWNAKSDFSGKYSDLTEKPIIIEDRLGGDHAVINAPYAVLQDGVNEKLLATADQIPSVGSGTLTINLNGSKIGTFSANQNSAENVNIEVPTNLSELGDDPDYQTVSQVEKDAWNAKLPASDGTLTGHLNLTERKNILLRPGNEHYTSGIGYDTAGNECVSLWAKNSVTRLRWNAGIDMTDMAPGAMMYITPDFEISKETGTAYGYIAGKRIVTDTIILENDVDLNTILASGFYRTSSSPLNGPETFSGAWSQLIVCRGADTVTQIISDYSSGQLATRAGNPPEIEGNGTWTSWRTIVDGDNISAQHVAYATGASQDSYGNVIYDTYLKKSGDIMSGQLQVNAPIFGYQYGNNSNSAAFIFDKPGSYYTGIGSHDEADTIYFGPVTGQADPTWVPGFKQKWKFQGSLIADSVGGVDGASVEFTSVDGNSVIDLSADYVGYNGNEIATVNQIPSRASDIGAVSTDGGQITGALYLPVSSGTHLSNYYISAGGGFSPNSGKYGVKVVCCDQPDCQTGLGQDLTGLNGGYELSIAGGRSTEGVGYISFAMHDVNSTDYTRVGYFDASGNFYASGNIYANGQQLTPGGGGGAQLYRHNITLAVVDTCQINIAYISSRSTSFGSGFSGATAFFADAGNVIAGATGYASPDRSQALPICGNITYNNNKITIPVFYPESMDGEVLDVETDVSVYIDNCAFSDTVVAI